MCAYTVSCVACHGAYSRYCDRVCGRCTPSWLKQAQAAVFSSNPPFFPSSISCATPHRPHPPTARCMLLISNPVLHPCANDSTCGSETSSTLRQTDLRGMSSFCSSLSTKSFGSVFARNIFMDHEMTIIWSMPFPS